MCNISSATIAANKICVNGISFSSRDLEELQQYRQIGTVEECRAAREKQEPKEPIYDGDGYASDGSFVWDEWLCPNCNARYEVDYDDYDYCPNCGQALKRKG